MGASPSARNQGAHGVDEETIAVNPSAEQPTPAPVETTKVAGPGASASTVGELVSRLSNQFSRLVRDELELAQIQLAAKGKKIGMGAGFLAVAALVSLYAMGVLIAAAILGLAEALPAWLSALIIGVVLLIIAGIAALLGKKKLDASKAHEVKLQEGLKQDVDAAKKGIQQ